MGGGAEDREARRAEKRARKEEKRARKEAKRSRREAAGNGHAGVEATVNGGAAADKAARKEAKRAAKAAKKAAAGAAPAGERALPKEPKNSRVAEVGNLELAKTGPPFRRAFYQEHADVAGMGAAQLAELREKTRCTVEPAASRPVRKFEQLGLEPRFTHACRNFQQPSPIQAECWPLALGGHDVVGIASTGSGKTLAFGIPALVHIAAQAAVGPKPDARGPVALVLGPTRELVSQIGEVLEEAGAKCGIKTACIYGGVPKEPQCAALARGVHIVAATPGRLQDLMDQGKLSLKRVTYLVLDEADRMLDMGFQPVIRAIARQVRSDRQTLMFSATWPMEVSNLAHEFLRAPYAKVTVGSDDLSASHSVKQIVEVCEPDERDGKLIPLLGKYHKSRKNRILIFVLYKKEAARVEQFLNRKGFPCVAVHGDMGQRDRESSVKKFHSGEVPLLVATDVAARGLDIPDVEYVLNYSFPLTVEDYVHRIGRTGRAGKTGISHTFFTVNDKVRSGELIGVLREAKQEIPQELYKFGTTIKKKESKLYGAHFKEVDLSKKGSKITFD